LQALWRLVRALFGGARRQADPEDGNFLAVHFPGKLLVSRYSIPQLTPVSFCSQECCCRRW
jgi:hypothetical protein